MSAKALYFVFIILLFALFSSFNLDNKVDVSLGFHAFNQIPVFLVSIFSFLVGCVLTLPFFFKSGKPKNSNQKTKKQETTNVSSNHEKATDTTIPPGVETIDLKGEKKPWFQNLIGKKKTDDTKGNEK